MRSDVFSTRSPGRCFLPESLMVERILGLCGVSLPTFNRLGRAGKLPPAIQISERRIGWRVPDLIEHLKAQPLVDSSTSR